MWRKFGWYSRRWHDRLRCNGTRLPFESNQIPSTLRVWWIRHKLEGPAARSFNSTRPTCSKCNRNHQLCIRLQCNSNYRPHKSRPRMCITWTPQVMPVFSFPFSLTRQNTFAQGPQIRANVTRPAPVQIRHAPPENGAQPMQQAMKGKAIAKSMCLHIHRVVSVSFPNVNPWAILLLFFRSRIAIPSNNYSVVVEFPFGRIPLLEYFQSGTMENDIWKWGILYCMISFELHHNVANCLYKYSLSMRAGYAAKVGKANTTPKSKAAKAAAAAGMLDQSIRMPLFVWTQDYWVSYNGNSVSRLCTQTQH